MAGFLRFWFSCYACAIRGIVRGARGCIKAATCWATRIPPIRFRRGYILLEDEEGRHPTSDHDSISCIVLLQVTFLVQFVDDLNNRRGIFDQVSRSPMNQINAHQRMGWFRVLSKYECKLSQKHFYSAVKSLLFELVEKIYTCK